MSLHKELYRRRKDNRLIFGGLGTLLLIFSVIYYVILRGRKLSPELVTNRVLLFVLWYVNLVLILIILFILLRNLLKLLVERRHRILGSKLKTKLIATYIGLSFIPAILLFLIAIELLQGWGDRWFTDPGIRQVLSQGYTVAQGMNDYIKNETQTKADQVLENIRGVDLSDQRQRPALTRRLNELLRNRTIDVLAVYEDSEFIHAVVNPQSGLSDLPDIRSRLIQEALQQGSATEIRPMASNQGRLILSAAALKKDDESQTENRRAVVVVGTLLPQGLAQPNEQLIRAYQGYRQQEVQKDTIKTSYLLTFLMMTLMILLAASWVGLYLARQITVPIQALAEGTRRVSMGDLAHRVDVEAGDELGILVSSFNQMTTELQRNKEELVTTNQNLAEERALIAAVLENVAAGVLSVSEAGLILFCNRAALKMLQQREEDVVGRPMVTVWSEGEYTKLLRLLEVDAGKTPSAAHHLRMILGGEWRTYEAKVTRLLDATGGAAGKIVVLEDLTELIKAQQVAAWRDAARRIAHEIKNPLTPIQLSAERLRKKISEDGPQVENAIEEGVEVIVREVEQMKSMVDEFSRFARMPQPQLQEVNLSDMVDDLVRLYADLKAGVNVGGHVDASAEIAKLDGEQLRGALINLLDNAIAATPAPGKVEVTAARTNGTLRIDVSDSGPGIPASAKEKLFLPYFSTKGRGTGLGLAIVHRIVTDHHGTIHVEDNQPHGTVFRIELPTD